MEQPETYQVNAHRDHVLPEGKWAFDTEVTEVFEEMLSRSIPQYAVMRGTVTELALRFAQKNTAIVDLGCSRGDAIAPLIKPLGGSNRFIGVEVSPPMLEAARIRFQNHIPQGTVSILNMDLRREFPASPASVILSVLTLQFTPIEYRLRIVQEAFRTLTSGGAFILVEKVLGSSADLDALFVDLYYGLKRRNGYSEEEIARKRLSLEGVLVPVTASWNEQLLWQSGFREVDCFWRHLNFAGWVAVKP